MLIPGRRLARILVAGAYSGDVNRAFRRIGINRRSSVTMACVTIPEVIHIVNGGRRISVFGLCVYRLSLVIGKCSERPGVGKGARGGRGGGESFPVFKRFSAKRTLDGGDRSGSWMQRKVARRLTARRPAPVFTAFPLRRACGVFSDLRGRQIGLARLPFGAFVHRCNGCKRRARRTVAYWSISTIRESVENFL